MKNYKFIEHTADIAAEVRGATLEDLFTNAAMAWQESALEEFTPQGTEEKEVKIVENTVEELMVSFLSELNFYLFTKKWVFGAVRSMQIHIFESEVELRGVITGENFNASRHVLKEEIKAITFHQMRIVKENNDFVTRIVFDI